MTGPVGRQASIGFVFGLFVERLFKDREQTGVVVVTLPEEMPVNETVELVAGVEGELHLNVEQIVVNGMLPPLFSQEERAALRAPHVLDETDPGDATLAAGVRRATREEVQAQSLARLTQELRAPKVYLPYLFDGAETRASLDELVRRL